MKTPSKTCVPARQCDFWGCPNGVHPVCGYKIILKGTGRDATPPRPDLASQHCTGAPPSSNGAPSSASVSPPFPTLLDTGRYAPTPPPLPRKIVKFISRGDASRTRTLASFPRASGSRLSSPLIRRDRALPLQEDLGTARGTHALRENMHRTSPRKILLDGQPKSGWCGEKKKRDFLPHGGG